MHIPLILSLLFALNPLLATPLADLQLKNGHSRALAKPDYLFKLLDAILRNSHYTDDEQRAVTMSMSDQGQLMFSDPELYNLDREARALLDPIFARQFPGVMTEYNLVFLDSAESVASVMLGTKRNAVPTIFIGRYVLNRISSEEEFIAVCLHEVFHRLRHHRVRGASRAQEAVLGHAIEDQADTLMVNGLIEAGRNPLGASALMEHILERGGPKTSYFEQNMGLQSHPPTEMRLTSINAKIEKLAANKSLPRLTPLPGEFKKIATLPDTEAKRTRYYAAEAQTLDKALSALAHLPLPIHPAEASRRLATEFELVRSRVNRNNLKGWLKNIPVQNLSWALLKVWTSLPAPLRNSSPMQDLFFSEDRKWQALAKQLSFEWISRDQQQKLRLEKFVRIETPAQLQEWAHEWDPFVVPDTRDTFEKPIDFGPSTYQSPELFVRAFENYIAISPWLFEQTERAIASGEEAALKAVRLARDFMRNSLVPWVELKNAHPKLIDIWARNVSEYRDSDLRFELAESARPLIIGDWDKRIAELPLPDYAKLAFFPSEVSKTFRWDCSSRGHLRGSPIFPSALGFLTNPSREDTTFARFHRGLRFLLALQPHRDAVLSFSKQTYGWSRYLGLEETLLWIHDSLANLKFSADDAYALLQDDVFWEKSEHVTLKETLNYARRVTDFGLGAIQFFQGRFSRREVRKLDRDLERTTKDLYRRADFYTRPEYQLNPRLSEATQALVYKNLRAYQTLPQNFNDEVELWSRFAKRGVSGFTDEWANSLITAFEHNPNRRELEPSLRLMYTSNLVWDLKLRERLALYLLSPQVSPEIAAIRDQSSSARWRALEPILKQMVHEFPENSHERLQVADRLAERIHANNIETTQIMAYFGHEHESVIELDPSRREGLGKRFFAQIFGEVQSSELASRLELLGFLLGQTDRTPSLLDHHFWSSTTQQNREAYPLLVQLSNGRIKPFRLRRAFQSLSLELRTLVLDPLFVGGRGLLASTPGRDWVIKTLVPPDVSWRQMAIDLVDGYRLALQKFGQSHLKTIFVSYLVAGTMRSSRSDFSNLFPGHSGASGAETNEGRLLRALFTANAALTKIGQRVHSSNVLDPSINVSLASLKESATRVMREDQFEWLKNAELKDGARNLLQLGGEVGNASVKIVMDAQVNGFDSILYMIKPNAYHRGEIFFEMLEYAVQYAINKGHDPLRLIQPMVARAKTTFKRETDLGFEREAAQRLANVYKPGKMYGDGFQFITPEFLNTNDLFRTDLVSAVRRIQVRKLSALEPTVLGPVAAAITVKELEVHQNPELVVFEKDRHEGNYLLVTDPELLAKFGLVEPKLILVIDFAQISTITAMTRSAVLDAVAALTLNGLKMKDDATTAIVLSDLLNTHILAADSPRVSPEVLQPYLAQLAESTAALKPGELLSRLLSYVETSTFKIKDDVWDYIAAVGTLGTWERLAPANAFATGMEQEIGLRCAEQLTGVDRE